MQPPQQIPKIFNPQLSIETQATTAMKGMDNQWEQIVQSFTALQRFVWANPAGATPQEVIAAFGTNAAKLFLLSGWVCDGIQALTGKRPAVMPDGWGFSINANGTVTLTAP